MIQRSIKNTMTRVIIARRLSVAIELVSKGRRDWMVMTHDEWMVVFIGYPVTLVWSFALSCYAFWPV